MPSLREIRQRIRSVKSSQKITKAMQLVAAAKLKRAQDAIVQARPYATSLNHVLHKVAASLSANDPLHVGHPCLELRLPSRVLLVVITSDRGLCGAFNTNVLRRTERFVSDNRERFASIEITAIGRKAREYFTKRQLATLRPETVSLTDMTFAKTRDFANVLLNEFVDKKLDAVFLIYNEFQSALCQRAIVQDVLPIVQPASALADVATCAYEPSQPAVLDWLIPQYMATQVWRALLESTASEHGARMTAMDSATRNARTITEDLTLQYNRARQANITRELMDIVGGAEALS